MGSCVSKTKLYIIEQIENKVEDFYNQVINDNRADLNELNDILTLAFVLYSQFSRTVKEKIKQLNMFYRSELLKKNTELLSFAPLGLMIPKPKPEEKVSMFQNVTPPPSPIK